MKKSALLMALLLGVATANNYSEVVITLNPVVLHNVSVPGPHRYVVGWQITEEDFYPGPSPCGTRNVPPRCAHVKVWEVPSTETLEQTQANVGRSGAAGSGRPLLGSFFQTCNSPGCTKEDKVLWIYKVLRESK